MPASKPLAHLIELIHLALLAQEAYPSDHPLARKSQADLEAFVPSLVGCFGVVRLTASGPAFTFQDEPVPAEPEAAQALARLLEARALGGLEFLPGLDPEELRTLMFILLLPPERVAELGGAAALLPDEGLLRVLPATAPTLAELPWEEVTEETFEPPPPGPEPLGPIAWIPLTEPDLPGFEPPFLPETVPLQIPEPEPLTPEELKRVPVAQPPPATAPLSSAALHDGLVQAFQAALGTTAPMARAGLRSPWGMDHRATLDRFGFALPVGSSLAGTGERLRLAATDPGLLRDALRKTFQGFEPAVQANLPLVLHAIPPREKELREALAFLAPELLAQAVAQAFAAQHPSMTDLAQLAVALLQCVREKDVALNAIKGRLRLEGWTLKEAEAFEEAVRWECPDVG